MASCKECCLSPLTLCCLRLHYRKANNKKNVLPPVKYSFLLIPANKLALKIRQREVCKCPENFSLIHFFSLNVKTQ